MSLKLHQCARCKRVFPRVKSPVCPDCRPEEDADFERIHDVLDYDSDLTPEEVAEAADVPVDCVLRMLDEGLISNAGPADAIRCGRCGAPAISRTKRLCQACLVKLDAEFARAVSATRMNKRLRDEAAESVHETVEQKRRTSPKALPREPKNPNPENATKRTDGAKDSARPEPPSPQRRSNA